MAIKCLANKSLVFKRNGEKVKTIVGFNTLPEWVEGDAYYNLAVKAGEITPFNGSNTSEVKITDEMAADIKEAEEKLRILNEQLAEIEGKIEDKEAKLAEVVESGNEQVKSLKEEIRELEEKKSGHKGRNK